MKDDGLDDWLESGKAEVALAIADVPRVRGLLIAAAKAG